ncbi:MAG TPA: phosphate ABC transporter, permease protein PstA, partial [Micromonosporaceae bacterium]
MSTATLTPSTPLSLHARRLPKWAPAGIFVLAAIVAFLVIDLGGAFGGGIALSVVATVVLFVLVLGGTSRVIEGPRAARNRMATAMIYTAFALALLPLFLVVKTLITLGHSRLDQEFFTHSNRDITP